MAERALTSARPLWRELREQALAESRLLRDEAKLELLASHIPTRGWDEKAPCKGAYGLFFPDGNDYRAARAVCGDCTLGLPCLAANLDEQFGCFAGTTPPQRRRIRRALAGMELQRAHLTAEQQRRNRNQRQAA